MTFALLALPVGFVLLFGVWRLAEALGLPGSIVWFAKRSAEKQEERLLGTPTADLVSEARETIRTWGFQALQPSELFLREDDWSDEELMHALNELYAAIIEDDDRHGRAGRDSRHFDFHDSGLAWILAALEKRTGSRATTRR